MRNLISILLICFAFSCSDSRQHTGKRRFGLYIENGPREGFQFFDSLGTEYRYRYTTTTITNDSIVPVRLNIIFPNEYNHPCCDSSERLSAFLLPRELTPEKQRLDESMSKELKQFLGMNRKVHISLDKTINPKEKYVMTFGVLSNMKCEDPSQITLELKSDESDKKLSLSLRLDFLTFHHKDTCYLALPCGQFLFTKQ